MDAALIVLPNKSKKSISIEKMVFQRQLAGLGMHRLPLYLESTWPSVNHQVNWFNCAAALIIPQSPWDASTNRYAGSR